MCKGMEVPCRAKLILPNSLPSSPSVRAAVTEMASSWVAYMRNIHFSVWEAGEPEITVWAGSVLGRACFPDSRFPAVRSGGGRSSPRFQGQDADSVRGPPTQCLVYTAPPPGIITLEMRFQPTNLGGPSAYGPLKTRNLCRDRGQPRAAHRLHLTGR